MASFCPQSLALTDCPDVMLSHVASLARETASLTQLRVTGCKRLSKRGLEILSKVRIV